MVSFVSAVGDVKAVPAVRDLSKVRRIVDANTTVRHFFRFAVVTSNIPVAVRRVRLGALALAAGTLGHFLLGLFGSVEAGGASSGEFFAGWVLAANVLVFGLRELWVWVTAVVLASLQIFVGLFTVISGLPSQVGILPVLAVIAGAGAIVAMLLRPACSGWFFRRCA
ncbi:hypothetical protein [Nocardia australiensis]|uniref:hypothetical protein n=1 Tax=Nocardia australiensis TaxID=2887191 RepID=UPI001D151EB4|nr:hypothetical protein [Nocardia australiensis]